MPETEITEDASIPKTDEIFADLLEESFGSDERLQGKVVTGTVLAVENDLRLIEVPVTFKKRIGNSKIGTGKNLGTIKMGLVFLWVILRY